MTMDSSLQQPPVVSSEPNHGDSQDRKIHIYQVREQKNKYICGGRFMFGPETKSLLFTLSLILVPLILFWAYVAQGIIDKYPKAPGVVIIAFSVVLILHIIISLFLTSCTDPGIIPRNPNPPEPETGETFRLSTDSIGSHGSTFSIPLTKNILVNGISIRVKYCQTCMLYRPPRCSHCSICNNCCERFDHHCPWVGQCIGKRNYRYFFVFVSSTTLLCFYMMATCWINLRWTMEKDDCNLMVAISASPVSGMLIVYTFVMCWFVGGLTVFHLYLISINQTTYENFRLQYDEKANPFDMGCLGNFKEVFCSKIPNSHKSFQEKIKCITTETKTCNKQEDESEDANERNGVLERCNSEP